MLILWRRCGRDPKNSQVRRATSHIQSHYVHRSHACIVSRQPSADGYIASDSISLLYPTFMLSATMLSAHWNQSSTIGIENTASGSSFLHSVPRENCLVMLPSRISHRLNYYHQKGFEPVHHSHKQQLYL